MIAIVLASILSLMPSVAGDVMCFKQGERTSGFNKICFYDCLGSEAAITIGAVDLCPLTIEKDSSEHRS